MPDDYLPDKDAFDQLFALLQKIAELPAGAEVTFQGDRVDRNWVSPWMLGFVTIDSEGNEDHIHMSSWRPFSQEHIDKIRAAFAVLLPVEL